METPIQNLVNDHDHILRLIDVMEKITETEAPDPDHLEMVVNLIKHFADGLHHAKEENLLFPLLVQRGFSFEAGPIFIMMKDHVEGRGFVKGMAENIPLYRDGDEDALKSVYANMYGYIELLRSHIYKENHVLFPMAGGVMTAEDLQSLAEQFSNVEAGEVMGGTKADCLAHIESLAGFYQV